MPLSQSVIEDADLDVSVGFHFEAKFDDVMSSECTSCAVRQDKSVYWTPALYFQHEDGKTELVEQNGGMLV